MIGPLAFERRNRLIRYDLFNHWLTYFINISIYYLYEKEAALFK